MGIKLKFAFTTIRDFDGGDKYLIADSMFELGNMKRFFESLRFPSMMEFDGQAAQRIFTNRLSTLVLFTDEESNTVISRVRDISMGFDKLVFTKSTLTKGYGSKMAEHLGATEENQIIIFEFNG